MKGNISVISYDCYQQATEKQLEGVNDFMSCHQTAHTNCHQIA